MALPVFRDFRQDLRRPRSRRFQSREPQGHIMPGAEAVRGMTQVTGQFRGRGSQDRDREFSPVAQAAALPPELV